MAKDVYQLHGINSQKQIVLRKQVKRKDLAELINKLSPCTIILEACGSAHFWSRKFEGMGHKVFQISPQHAKPFVRGNKNDKNDSIALITARLQEEMPTVPLKIVEQQGIQLIHGERAHLIR